MLLSIVQKSKQTEMNVLFSFLVVGAPWKLSPPGRQGLRVGFKSPDLATGLTESLPS